MQRPYRSQPECARLAQVVLDVLRDTDGSGLEEGKLGAKQVSKSLKDRLNRIIQDKAPKRVDVFEMAGGPKANVGSAGSLGLPFESATSLLGFLSSHCSHTVTVQKAKVKSQGSFAWPTVNRFTPSLEAGTYLPQDLPELCEKALRKWEPFTWEMLSTELVAADPNADYSAPFAGEQIVFQGLSEDGASLNGCNGTCLFLHKDIGRYVVRVLSGLREGEHVHVKPANLVVPLGDGSGGDAREADSGEGGAEAHARRRWRRARPKWSTRRTSPPLNGSSRRRVEAG